MEDGGTLGAHALALLKMLAEYAVAQGCYSSPDSRSPLTPPMQVSLWMQRWQQRLSTWLHVSLSQQILRLYRPAGILSAGLLVALLELSSSRGQSSRVCSFDLAVVSHTLFLVFSPFLIKTYRINHTPKICLRLYEYEYGAFPPAALQYCTVLQYEYEYRTVQYEYCTS